MSVLGVISPGDARRTLERLGRDIREQGHAERTVPWRAVWYVCWDELVDALGGDRERAVDIVLGGFHRG